VEAVMERVRKAHADVRLSVSGAQVEQQGAPVCSIAVLGADATVSRACLTLRTALVDIAAVILDEQIVEEAFFLLQFTLREAWDPAPDDELTEEDWVDLGTSKAVEQAQETLAQARASSPSRPRSTQSVVRQRLLDAIPHNRQDLLLFMDRNPLTSCGADVVRVDLLGPLRADAWQAAASVILNCEAHQVYLSRRYDALFWAPAALRSPLEGQLSCAMSHWKGATAELGHLGGFGISGTLAAGFEDLAANVKAVLRGVEPPGWHRLEWTPHGAGSFAYMTY